MFCLLKMVKQKQGKVKKRWTWLWDWHSRDYDNTPVILEEYSKAFAQHCLFNQDTRRLNPTVFVCKANPDIASKIQCLSNLKICTCKSIK